MPPASRNVEYQAGPLDPVTADRDVAPIVRKTLTHSGNANRIAACTTPRRGKFAPYDQSTATEDMTSLARLLSGVVFIATVHAQPPDPLPSWNDGIARQRILTQRDWNRMFPFDHPAR
jgi:hypothetical protein